MHRVFAAACALKEAENKRLISAMSNWVIRLNRFLENMNAELERLLVAAAPHLEAVARGVSNMMIMSGCAKRVATEMSGCAKRGSNWLGVPPHDPGRKDRKLLG